MAKVELKKPVVEEISAVIEGAACAVIVDYRGLTVEQDTRLRDFHFSLSDASDRRTAHICMPSAAASAGSACSFSIKRMVITRSFAPINIPFLSLVYNDSIRKPVKNTG